MKNLNRKENHLSDKYDGDLTTSRSGKYQDSYRQHLYESYDALPIDYLTHEQQQANSLEIEQLWELEHDLQDIMWYLIQTHLTSYQVGILQILKLAILCGEGQTWMAEQLNVGQPSIVKALHGNKVYEGGQIKSYGGIKKKLEKIIQNCPLIRTKMKQIEAMNYEVVRLPHFKCFKKIIGNAAKYEQYLKQENNDTDKTIS
jgi:hypothetical protein